VADHEVSGDITEVSGADLADVIGDVAQLRARKCERRAGGWKLRKEGDFAHTGRILGPDILNACTAFG